MRKLSGLVSNLPWQVEKRIDKVRMKPERPASLRFASSTQRLSLKVITERTFPSILSHLRRLQPYEEAFLLEITRRSICAPLVNALNMLR